MATNDEVLLSYLSGMGLNINTSIVFISFFAALFVCLYFLIPAKVDKTGLRILLAASPFIIVDVICTAFGTYTFELPLVGTIIINRLVNTLHIIDYIAYFKAFGAATTIINSYDIGSYQLSGMGTILIYVYNYIDTIAQIALLSMGAYSIISWMEITFNKRMGYWKGLISLLFGLAPTTYMMFTTKNNPFTEYQTLTDYATQLSYFINYGSQDDIIKVLAIGLLAFGLFYIFVMIFVHLFFSVITQADFKGGLNDMSYNYQLYTLIIALLYTCIFIVHPDYKWYTIFIYLTIYYLFKKFFDSIVAEAKNRNDLYKKTKANNRALINEFRSEFGGKPNMNMNQNNVGYKKERKGSSWSYIIPLMIGAGLLVYVYFFA